MKTSGNLDQKLITAKVVQKSNLASYQTQTQEKKFYFHLGVADETDCIKVIVYGQERFDVIEEGCFYNFRNVIMDAKENVVRVTMKTKMSKTAPFDIAKNLELEAAKLISSPVSSIAEIQTFDDKTAVSVEGTVKEVRFQTLSRCWETGSIESGFTHYVDQTLCLLLKCIELFPV